MLPPPINGRPAKWVRLHNIEAILGMAYDEMNLILPMRPRMATFTYRRIAPNKWVLMHGNEVVTDRGNPIIVTDSILASTLRPDVAIVNPQTKTFQMRGQ